MFKYKYIKLQPPKMQALLKQIIFYFILINAIQHAFYVPMIFLLSFCYSRNFSQKVSGLI